MLTQLVEGLLRGPGTIDKISHNYFQVFSTMAEKEESSMSPRPRGWRSVINTRIIITLGSTNVTCAHSMPVGLATFVVSTGNQSSYDYL